MHLNSIIHATIPLAAHAANIVIANDDGWAEINIRQFYNVLTAAGESAIVSAPAENESGTGSLTADPTVLTEPCEFDSCATGSPAVGYNASNTRLNYVNSYPATAMKYGISTLAPEFFDGAAPDLAVAGPNVGSNLGITTLLSGTVGATVEAVNLGIPAIAFSGVTGSATAWNETVPSYSTIYADLATNITQTLLASGSPYLPSGIWLNVNFPTSETGTCDQVSDFKFVLSRIYTNILKTDVETCDSTHLPSETSVVDTDGCYASISVGQASNKLDASETNQAIVLSKLGSILSCLP